MLKGKSSVLKVAVLFMLICTMVLGCFSMSSYAAPKTPKVKTVKKMDGRAPRKDIRKHAVKVGHKKKVTLRGTQGWFKFKAPKTKTYRFTFNNLRTEGLAAENDFNYGYFVMAHVTKKYVQSVRPKTQYGRAYAMFLTTQTDWNRMTSDGIAVEKVTEFLPSRKAVLKMKKGETIYGYFQFRGKGTARVDVYVK